MSRTEFIRMPTPSESVFCSREINATLGDVARNAACEQARSDVTGPPAPLEWNCAAHARALGVLVGLLGAGNIEIGPAPRAELGLVPSAQGVWLEPGDRHRSFFNGPNSARCGALKRNPEAGPCASAADRPAIRCCEQSQLATAQYPGDGEGADGIFLAELVAHSRTATSALVPKFVLAARRKAALLFDRNG